MKTTVYMYLLMEQSMSVDNLVYLEKQLVQIFYTCMCILLMEQTTFSVFGCTWIKSHIV